MIHNPPKQGDWIDWKTNNQSQLQKEESALLIILLTYLVTKHPSCPVLALKIDNFVLKVKPRKIFKLNKLKH